MNVEKALRSIGLQDITVRDRAIGARKIKDPFQQLHQESGHGTPDIFSITAGGHRYGSRGTGGWIWKRENAEGLPVSELLGRILDKALRNRWKELTWLGFSPPIQLDELPSMKTATDAATSATALVGRGGLRKPLARRVLSFLRGRTHAQANQMILRAALQDFCQHSGSDRMSRGQELLKKPLCESSELVELLELLSCWRDWLTFVLHDADSISMQTIVI